MIRSLLTLTALISLTLPAALATATPAQPQPPQDEPLLDVSMKYQLRLLNNPDPSEMDIRLYEFANLEQAGYLPPGFTDSMVAEQVQPRMERPPQRIYRDLYVVCDLDGDGVQDILTNEINRLTASTSVWAWSGATGDSLWYRPGMLYIPAPTPPLGPNAFGVYNKPGYPQPNVPRNLEPTIDVNDDGVCDFILYGASLSRLGAAGQSVTTILFQFSAVNGSYGYFGGPGFWSFTERSTITIVQEPNFGLVAQINVLNFVTGFTSAFTPNGHRFVIKTTDVSFTIAQDPFGICFVNDWRTEEHIQYRESRGGTKMWQRDLNMTREDDATRRSSDPTGKSKEKVNNITYITGMTQLAGDDEYEVLLHQFQFTTPRTCQLPSPTGAPLFTVGTSMSILALRGDKATSGADLWRNVIYDSGTYQVNAAAEESFEFPVWVFGQILPDLNGDGKPDMIASVLMQELNPATTNGQFRTHIHPIDGATGAKMLGPDVAIRQQGWGYSAWMGTDPTKSSPYFAFGSVDIPTAFSSTSRFPPKDVRLTVFDTTDGSPLWSWREQFAQDSYLQYHLTLHQYLSALAPYDFDGDGMRELLTPAQYVAPNGAEQTLLAQAEHIYQVLNGQDGTPLHTIRAWGPTGVALTCRFDEPGIAVFSGHSRRIDVSYFELGVGNTTVTQTWRHPLYNNPDFAAATQGTDIVTWSSKCMRDNEGRFAFSTNPELFSLKRGFDIKNVFGFIQEDGELEWQIPPVDGKPPISLEELLRYFEIETPSPALTLAFTAGPIAPGILAGIALGRLRAKKGGL